jgi:hypothetical protein
VIANVFITPVMGASLPNPYYGFTIYKREATSMSPPPPAAKHTPTQINAAQTAASYSNQIEMQW